MKKIIILLLAAACVIPMNTSAQKLTLKKVMELKMPKTTDDELCGTRGGSVCWNPLTKKYYAGFAGNTGFPLGVFDAKGKRLSADELTTMVDLRGLWYNPISKKICGNGYAQSGWFSYTLDKKGIPTDFSIDFEGKNQPDENCVGTINTSNKLVTFLNKDQVVFYKNDATEGNSLTLQLGEKKSGENSDNQEPDNSSADFNNTSVIYSGIIGSELGLLNTEKKQIELYSYLKGSRSKIFILPDTAPVEKSFNFAFANGIYWLFDIADRKWIGYK